MSTPRWKRAFDLTGLALMTGFYLPFGIAIAAAILLEDGFPIFFTQPRTGLGRRPFRIFKFRTMRDGKVTRVGAVVRKSGLDELPQFLNIWLGQMSFVGPRPLTEEDIRRIGWEGRHHDFRWRMLPGITGYAQVFSGQGARESLARDRLYLRRMNLGWDITILAATFIMNFLGKSRVKKALKLAFPKSRSRLR